MRPWFFLYNFSRFPFSASYGCVDGKITVLWDLALCILVDIYRRFGGTRYHRQSRRVS
jgi:hypothetical protein